MSEFDEVPERNRSASAASREVGHPGVPHTKPGYFSAKKRLVRLRRDEENRHTFVKQGNADRVGRVLRQAEAEGLVGREKDTKISGRVNHLLIERARANAHIESTTDLIEYALAKVAVEDRYGDWLADQEGTVSPELDLDI